MRMTSAYAARFFRYAAASSILALLLIAPTANACSSSLAMTEFTRLGMQSQCGMNGHAGPCYTDEIVRFTIRASGGFQKCSKFQWEFDDGAIVPVIAESCAEGWCTYAAERVFTAPGRQRTQPVTYLPDGRRMQTRVTMTFDVVANPDPPEPEIPARRRSVRSR